MVLLLNTQETKHFLWAERGSIQTMLRVCKNRRLGQKWGKLRTWNHLSRLGSNIATERGKRIRRVLCAAARRFRPVPPSPSRPGARSGQRVRPGRGCAAGAAGARLPPAARRNPRGRTGTRRRPALNGKDGSSPQTSGKGSAEPRECLGRAALLWVPRLCSPGACLLLLRLITEACVWGGWWGGLLSWPLCLGAMEWQVCSCLKRCKSRLIRAGFFYSCAHK